MANRISAVTEVSPASNSKNSFGGAGTSAKKKLYYYPLDAIVDNDRDYLSLKCFKYMEDSEGGNKLLNITRDTNQFTGNPVTQNGRTYKEHNPHYQKIKNIEVNAVTRYSSKFDPNKKNLFRVLLPIPAGIQDANSVGWGEDEVNPLAGAVAGAAAGAAGSDNPFDALGAAGEAVLGEAGEGFDPATKELMLTYLGGKAANAMGANVNPASLVTRATGAILQSNLELLFKNVRLRQFTFNFNFSPRDLEEANECKEIIKVLKQAMAPSDGSPAGTGGDVGSGATGWFIGSPHVFQLEYMKGNNRHPFLHSFKPCALTDIGVNYTASGMYSTYEDGTPTHMTMSCSFKEINPIYNQDYDHGSAGPGVGF